MGKKNKISYCSWGTIYSNLKSLYISTFLYDNLPESINKDYMEKVLLDHGHGVFFKDPVTDEFLFLRATGQSTLDVYGEFKIVNALADNGSQFNGLINGVDCVVIYDKSSRRSAKPRLMDYAKRIFNIERTIDINVHNQRTSKMIKATKESEASVRKILQEVNEYYPSVIVDRSTNVEEIFNSYDITTPYVSDKLEELKKKRWHEVLDFIGIINNSGEKNERLVAGEVLINNGLSIANRSDRLTSRQEGLDKVNKMFELDIKVEIDNIAIFSNMNETTTEQPFENLSKEGENNESVL